MGARTLSLRAARTCTRFRPLPHDAPLHHQMHQDAAPQERTQPCHAALRSHLSVACSHHAPPALAERALVPLFAVPVRKQGGQVQVQINVNAKAQFESKYWRGVLDAQGKVDGGYY